jgi:parvulin-like peptidyl-prolyl isomerase
MPAPPTRPLNPWTPAAAQSPGATPPPYTGPVIGEPMSCEGGQLLARVGSMTVLSGELSGGIYDTTSALLADKRLPPDKLEEQRNLLAQEIKEAVADLAAHSNDANPLAGVTSEHLGLIRFLLRQHIETLMLYNDARATIPEERLPDIEEGMKKDFEEVQLKRLLKQAGVQSPVELDRKLRALGSSLERERQWFMQQMLAEEWKSQQIKSDEEITHQEMLEWYQGHLHNFDHPARARWEELMVRTAKYPNKAEAYAAIARMGNQVVLGGRPLAEVARAQSDGRTAANGGRHDWTTKGGLAAEELDRALFGLPVGQLSPILESESGLHIVRVVERQDAMRTSFPQAQDEIRKQIKKERSQKKAQDYLAKVQRLYPPWTIFDEVRPPENAARHPDASRY